MSVHLVAEVVCDDCGRVLVGVVGQEADAALEAAVGAGWTDGDGVNACPEYAAPDTPIDVWPARPIRVAGDGTPEAQQ